MRKVHRVLFIIILSDFGLLTLKNHCRIHRCSLLQHEKGFYGCYKERLCLLSVDCGKPFSSLKDVLLPETLKAITIKSFKLSSMTTMQEEDLSLLPAVVVTTPSPII
ncbi:hypothetical protein ARMGADRAFT_1136854 [Armillaria gallica]|uniref:Uncharacterized protein n=1 Tax=Armillaria gallica TaxID=47427 RepID=A0A2H3CP03_ARMGA|nr:hypothetical protein ARMGADRAFT_1136854 [Armillaria gallica]